MQIYIYHDSDHGDIEVFESLEKAKQFTQEHWGPTQEWEECGKGKDGECDHWHDLYSDYVSIYRRSVPTNALRWSHDKFYERLNMKNFVI